MEIIFNFLINCLFLYVLVHFKFATIGNFDYMTGMEKTKIIIELGLFSMLGTLFGIMIANFASLMSFFLLAIFSWFIIGWVTIGFLESLNFSFNYIEVGGLQDWLVYLCIGFFYKESRSR
jgi:hypothetical protein